MTKFVVKGEDEWPRNIDVHMAMRSGQIGMGIVNGKRYGTETLSAGCNRGSSDIGSHLRDPGSLLAVCAMKSTGDVLLAIFLLSAASGCAASGYAEAGNQKEIKGNCG